MKPPMTFKKVLLTAHLCMGLAACLFLVVLGSTGAVMAFENDFNRAVNPHLLEVKAQGTYLAWEVLRQKVEQQRPEWRVQRIYMPSDPSSSTYVRLASRRDGHTSEIYANQYTGEVLGEKEHGNQLIWEIHEIHISLGAGNAGSQAVAVSAGCLTLLAISGVVLWWPRKIFWFGFAAPAARTNYNLHRTLGWWSSIVMLMFALTGINLHLQTGGGLFQMMDAKSASVPMPGHGTTVDEMLQSAREAIPGATAMRISIWDEKRPVLVQMRFPEDHTPAGRSAVTLDRRTGAVLTVVSSRTAPMLYTALVQWNRELHTGTIFDRPSQAVASMFSFLLCVLALSGLWIWINRKLGAARRRRIAAGSAKETLAPAVAD
jgi:uncharacterized iron-regulated membrane protein